MDLDDIGCGLTEEIEEIHKNLARIVSVPSKVQIQHLPNISLESYCYNNPFC
jgi:hypothetical protein